MADALKEVYAEFGIKIDLSIIDAANASLDAMIARLEAVAGSTVDRTNVDALDAVAKSAREASTSLNDTGKKAEEAGKKLKRQGADAKSAADDTEKLEDSLGDLVQTLVGLAALKSAFEWIGGLQRETDQLAARFGFTAEQVSTLRTAARSSGIELSEMGETLGDLAGKFGEAVSDRGGGIADTFRDLGIEIPRSMEDLPSVDGQLRLVADALANIQDPAERAMRANQLLGGAGVKLLPILGRGSRGLDEMAARTRKLGGGFAGPGVTSVTTFTHALGDLQTVMESLAARAIDAVSSAFEGLGVDLADVTAVMFDVLDNGRLLETLLGALTVAAVAFGVKSAAAWAASNWSLLVTLATVALLVLIFEDLWVGMEGGDSVIFRMVDELLGIGAARGTIEGVRLEFELLWEILKANFHVVTQLAKALGSLAIGDFSGVAGALNGIDLESRIAEARRVYSAGMERVGGATQQQAIFNARNDSLDAMNRVRELTSNSTVNVNLNGPTTDQIAKQIGPVVEEKMRQQSEDLEGALVDGDE